MPTFWQFPTVSMGLGAINAIYQARFNRYLHHRGLKDTSGQHVWAFLGDGEMDEVEALGALGVAAREELDNLTFVVNCNLQRLDGPVRGNGKIIQELEALFRGAGWNVIKVIWGRQWDPLLAADTDGALVNLMNVTPDGDYQTDKAESGAFVREHFFGRDPRTAALVAHLSDEQIWGLTRGGHDYRKLYAAYQAAVAHTGQPTVILAKTIKGLDARVAFRGPQRHPPDEETHPRRPQGLPGPAAPRHPRRGARRDPAALPSAARPVAGAGVPARATQRPGWLPTGPDRARPAACATAHRGVCSRRPRFRPTTGRHHNGVRAAAQRPDERPAHRSPFRADHPRRGPHLRPGRPVPVQEDLLTARTALPVRRPGTHAQSYQEDTKGRPADEGITEAGADGVLDRRRHLLRHPRRTDDPGLHLLLHVRVPAHRRRPVGGRRPDDPRLPARRHRRPDHPQRRRSATPRRPLAAAGLHQPRLRRLRRRSPRDSATSPATACAACTGQTGKKRLLLPHPLQRTHHPTRPTGRRGRRRHPAPACTAQPRRQHRRARAQILASGIGHAMGAARHNSCCATTGASPPTSGR